MNPRDFLRLQAEQQAREESFASALATFVFFMGCLVLAYVLGIMLMGPP